MVNSSFRVRGRNCSIDVCWEEKKFRVICSHLNPGSVGHLYAKDLEDLSMLTVSREKDSHVHICVDAQTGLCTGVLGPCCSNIGTATTVTHRAEKQRLLECFIMEHLLIATLSATTTTETLTSTRATTMDVTNHSRLTTSCHLTTVCVPELSTHRLLHRITGDSRPP